MICGIKDQMFEAGTLLLVAHLGQEWRQQVTHWPWEADPALQFLRLQIGLAFGELKEFPAWIVDYISFNEWEGCLYKIQTNLNYPKSKTNKEKHPSQSFISTMQTSGIWNANNLHFLTQGLGHRRTTVLNKNRNSSKQPFEEKGRFLP